MIVEPCTASGSIAVTAGSVVSSKTCLLVGVTLNPAAAACTVTVYDNASAASGTILCNLVAAASSSSVVFQISVPVCAQNGLTVAVTGTGATAEVYYYRES